MKKIIIATLFVVIGFSSFSQKKYKISVKIKGMKDSLAYLASYTGKNLYYYDTAVVNKDGSFEFNNTDMPHGVYAIVASVNPPNYYDFIVNETSIKMESSLPDLVENMKIKKSKENTLFFNYIRFLKKQTDKKNPLMEKRKIASDSSNNKVVKSIDNKLKDIDNKVKEYQQNLLKNNPTTLLSKLVDMSIDIDIPEPKTKVKDTNQYKYDYYLSHYWNNTNLKDDRLGKASGFYNKMETYFLKVIPQVPDSIIKEIDKFLGQLKPNGFMMRSAVEFLAYAHAKTKIMGMENVYVHVADNYILNGRSEWIPDENIAKMKPKVDKLRPTLIGKIAPNITLADTTESKWINLHKDMNHKYTMLIFWDDDCGHCKKEMPKFKKLYDSIKNKTNIDFEVYAVGTSVENEGWKKFIAANDLNWINVSDFSELRDNPEKHILLDHTDINSINYRNTYDIFVTPVAYLLDSNKKIIAKQFDSKQLPMLLDIFEKESTKKKI